MAKRILGEVPAGCRQRLLAHYGPAAQPWLERAPDLVERAARRWKFVLGGYHDAGHASVIVTATTSDGHPLLLKAWFDPARYGREVAALRMWGGGPTAEVLETADDLAVAALELVGGWPGGAVRPRRETELVAAALQRLHTLGRRRRPDGLLLLGDYLRRGVLPRIRRRVLDIDLGEWRPLVDDAFVALPGLRGNPGRVTVLHADLYRENVPFDNAGLPRLIDPLPMLGDAAFDWAFWTVYYDLGEGTAERLETAAQTSQIAVAELVPWCRLLALDGLLYYLESSDERAPRMAQVLSGLSHASPRSSS
jgi:streptomycin 6-kinase